jgi:hypothetical protein
MDKQETMSWNYRILAENDAGEQTWYEIREVYYKNGEPSFYSLERAGPGGHSIAEILMDLDKMRDAVEKPILSLENFPQEYEYPKEEQ